MSAALDDKVFGPEKLERIGLGDRSLYQISLPATQLRRRGGLVTAVVVFDLTHIYDVIVLARRRVT